MASTTKLSPRVAEIESRLRVDRVSATASLECRDSAGMKVYTSNSVSLAEGVPLKREEQLIASLLLGRRAAKIALFDLYARGAITQLELERRVRAAENRYSRLLASADRALSCAERVETGV